MQANPVTIRIRDPSHPAHAGLNRLDEDFYAMLAANFDCLPNIVYCQRDACRAAPVPFGMAFMPGPVEAKGQRFRGELTPEIIPLMPTFEAEEFLVEGAGPSDVFCVIHHEIDRSNGNCGLTR